MCLSNGTLLGDSTLDFLANNHERINVLISVDGVGTDHDYIRGKGIFIKVDSTIRKLVQKGVNVEILFTVQLFNYKKYMEVINYARSLNISCNFNLFKPFKVGQEGLVLPPSEYFTMVNELIKMKNSGISDVGISNVAIASFLSKTTQRNECKGGVLGFSVDSDGRMSPCPALSYCGYYKSESLPFFDENFIHIWKEHEIFKKFRNGNLLECQVRAYIFSGNVSGYDPYGLLAFKKYHKA